jgi:ubiquinone/menaquinone biosynthesis C-methylase UbiE
MDPACRDDGGVPAEGVVTGLLDRTAYAIGQAARVAWFAGHHIAARRIGGPPTRPDAGFRITKERTTGREFLAQMGDLFARDWANVEAGLYAAPVAATPPLKLLNKTRDFLADAPRVDRRRRAHAHSEVMTDERRAKYPRYYLQNFHYQTDGWFSEDSARRYDFQVETLFAGTADAMRRLGLAPIARALRGKDQRKVHLLDMACGTGRFLAQIKQNWPMLNVTALDLSPAYLARAREKLSQYRNVAAVEANVEAMPLEDASQDIVTCVYLFHELPPKIRAKAAAEIVRVLKPGGTFVLTDSVQPRDGRGFDALTEFFPQAFHEPYYESYLDWRAEDVFTKIGLIERETIPAFLSTIRVFEAPI